MVGTGNGRRVPAWRINQPVAAMLTGIVECPQLAALDSRHDDALLQDSVGHEVTGVAQLIDVRHQVPAAKEDPQALLLEDRWVVEKRCRGGHSGSLVGLAPLDGHCNLFASADW